ncbi:MAG: GAF domain-containing protein, partial [Anaerolineae bacterium]|nr:GAF domain-containing protein [Anaerolineae bacterium]
MMKVPANTSILSNLRLYVNAASVFAIGISLTVMLGWIFNVDSLKSILPNAATMKFNTALSFLCAGISLWLIKDEEVRLQQKRVGQIFAGITLLIASLTMGEYIFDLDLGIDQFFVRDLATSPASFPGRMSQITAICFLCSALALLLINSKVSQFFSIPTATLALLALIGYLFAFESLYRLPGYGSVAIHTAFTLLILSLGILIARPTMGIMTVFSSNMPGSRVIRLLIPITILITISLAYIVEQSERASYFNAENALTIFAVLLILVYAPLFYFFAKRINQSEQRIMYGNRLYATLSQVNQTIVRVKSRQELFESICRIAVEFGEFRLAWIGLFDSETGQVTSVAEHGYGQNKLPFHNINAGEMPFREGLIGEAVQTAEITFSNDIQTDPDMKHWYEAAVQGDYHSAAAVPIRQGGRIAGLLNLYAADVGFFLLKEEQSLLTEMGLDISFALDTMQADAERGEVQERFEKVFQNSPLATVFSSIKDGKYLDVNDAFLKLTGFSREEV